jgi:Formate hydrogenlyase subunit 6/NADH:ubiquinone oxidoreductase 23 kD subunit (chain I)
MEAVQVKERWCKGCGICVAFCPKQALVMELGKARNLSDRCIVCGMCELYCPDLAIVVDKSKKPVRAKKEVA